MAFDLENMYLARTNKLLEVKEIRNTEDKLKILHPHQELLSLSRRALKTTLAEVTC